MRVNIHSPGCSRIGSRVPYPLDPLKTAQNPKVLCLAVVGIDVPAWVVLFTLSLPPPLVTSAHSICYT
jgi:hypothetical protein